MAEKEYKEKVKIDDDEAKIERESKDSFGNKVKEKQRRLISQVSKYATISVDGNYGDHFISF